MSHFDEKDLHKLMKLSKIECSQEEKAKFHTALARVVGYIDQLTKIDTEGVSPCNHILESMTNVIREDETQETLSRDVFLSNAPSHVGGMVKVPPIIKLSNS